MTSQYVHNESKYMNPVEWKRTFRSKMHFLRYYAGEFIVIVESFWSRLRIKILICHCAMSCWTARVSPIISGNFPEFSRKIPRIFSEYFQKLPRNFHTPPGYPIIFPYTPHPPPYPRFYPLPYPPSPNFNPVFLQFTFFIQGYIFIPPDSCTKCQDLRYAYGKTTPPGSCLSTSAGAVILYHFHSSGTK